MKKSTKQDIAVILGCLAAFPVLMGLVTVSAFWARELFRWMEASW